MPTVNPVTTSALAPVLIRAAAAGAHVAEAATVFGNPENDNTPAETVPAVAFNVNVAQMVAMPAVPISSLPDAPMSVTTAVSREFLVAVA